MRNSENQFYDSGAKSHRDGLVLRLVHNDISTVRIDPHY